MMEIEDSREEVAHIPWSMLADELDGGRSRTLISLVLAVVVLAVVVFVGVRTLRRTPGTVVDIPVDHPATTVAAPAVTEPAQDELPPPSAPVSPGLYAEADLMAVAPEQEQRLAAARAEWFVVDYFTVDDVAAAEPAMWVEWARATEVVSIGPGRYDVVVAFSTLGRGLGGVYARAGPRAVRVAIETSAAGVAVPVDLPAPVPLDASTVPDPPAATGDPVPDDIASAAAEAAASFGSDAEVTGGAAVADGWRVMVSVADPTGIRFPLVVHVDG